MNQNYLKVLLKVIGLRPQEQIFGANESVEIHQNQVKVVSKIFYFDNLVKNQQIQLDDNILEQDQYYITYGSTASGKTTALLGENGIFDQMGIKYFQTYAEATISIIEVQGSKIVDLFSKQVVKITEGERSFSGKNLTKNKIKNFDVLKQAVTLGYSRRLMSNGMMNNQATRFPFIVKLDFGHFALHFIDLVGSQQVKYCSKENLHEVQFANSTSSIIQQIIKSKKENKRLLLSNFNLVTKIIKNAFRDSSKTFWIVCISTSSRSEKETLQVLEAFSQN